MNLRRIFFIFIMYLLASQLLAQQSKNEVLKGNALILLEQKCNVCHLLDYPRNVFTMENMNSFSKKIYKQVFVKNKMPKGDSIRLSDSERTTLISWLETQLKIVDN